MIYKNLFRSAKTPLRDGLGLGYVTDIFKNGKGQTRLLSTRVEPANKVARAWNDAASLMLVAPMNNSEPYSLGYLLVERSRTGRVMPGSWVFPGGNYDRVDSDPMWIDLFEDTINVDLKQERYFEEGAHIPDIYSSENDGDIVHHIPKEVSFRITAIRETFEEAGVLLCRPRRIDPEKHLINGMLSYEFEELEDKKELQTWQKRVRKNAREFIEMCRQLDCVPDIRALNDWSNWLTPAIMKAKVRFDTIFYMTILPKLPRVVVDGNEAGKAQWFSPTTVLSEHAKGQIRLAPPQVYEFQRLKSVQTIHELRDRMGIRKTLGVERGFPVVRKINDGTLFILPGDDLYPETPNYTGPESIEEIPKTMAELKNSSSNFHRGISPSSDGIVTTFEINVTRYGQMY